MRRPKKLLAITSTDGIDEVFTLLSSGPLATDTETTGLDWSRDMVGGICLAAGDTAAFFYRDALGAAARYLHDAIRQHRTFVFHNAKFDLHFLRSSFGLHFPYPVHDTMLQSHLLDNRGAPGAFGRGHHGGHSLKQLAAAFVDSTAHDPEKELMAAIRACGGRTKGDWMVLLGTPYEKIAVKYSALDPWLTLQLHTQFVPRLRHWPQPEGYPPLWTLYRNECWLTLALRDMEERGICASRPFLERWRDTLIKDVRRSLRALNKMAGDRDINWNSAPQLREFLFNKKSHGGLGLEATAQTKSHADSTDKHALIKLNHPIGAELLNYRKLTKQLGTYAEGLLSAMHADDTIHCWFNQNVDTGRMSCSNPNLQQQTRGQGVRGAYVPREGTVFRFADYSQIEMRFAAHEAEEPTLIAGFNTEDDFDTHRATAQVMFGVDAPTDEQRSFAKTMNFATLYGAGEDRVTEGLMDRMTVVEAMRNCRKLGYRPSFAESPHRALAKLLLARYRANLPAMKRATRHESDIAERRGFVMNAFGRHRYLEDEAWYTAFNTKIQGDAADQAKVGLVKVYRKLQLGRGAVALLLQVHDEIIYETDGDPAVDREVLELLAERKRFRVPIVADLKGSAVSWQDKVAVPL